MRNLPQLFTKPVHLFKVASNPFLQLLHNYFNIHEVYIKHGSIISIAGALSACFYLQRNSLWENEGFSLQGSLSQWMQEGVSLPSFAITH